MEINPKGVTLGIEMIAWYGFCLDPCKQIAAANYESLMGIPGESQGPFRPLRVFKIFPRGVLHTDLLVFQIY